MSRANTRPTETTSLPPMPKRLRPEPPAGRYTMDIVIDEIAKMRDREGLDDKDIWSHPTIEIEQSNFSRKMANIGKSKFTIEELGRIADFFSRRTNRLLPGWPFVPETECRLIEAKLGSAKPPQGHGK